MSVFDLVEHHPPLGMSRYQWEPYVTDAGFRVDWWHRPWDLGDRYSLWSLFDDGVEVARIELDEQVYYDHYDGDPPLGPAVLEVDFFEVSVLARGRGVGRAALEMIAEQHQGRRLVAFSEEADGFWARVGWTRYDHPDGFPLYRPLFVAPEGWPALDADGRTLGHQLSRDHA
jgi:GNAT superfamily N-acetyltransferase